MASLSEDSDVDEELSRDLRSLDEVLQGIKASEKAAPVKPQEQDHNLSKLKQCLEKNMELQRHLVEQLNKVEAALVLNKQKSELLGKPRRNKALLARTLTFWSFKRGKYFKDHLGMTPPTEKGDDDQFQEMYSESHWKRSNTQKRLVDSVRIQAIEERTRPLLDQLEMAPPTRKVEIKHQVNEIKNLTDKELFEGLNPDSIDWKSLSYEMLGHTHSASDCRLQWINQMSPLLNKGEWSQDEDRALVKLAQKHGERDWVKVSRELGTNRSAFNCLRHYQSCRLLAKKGGKWTQAEDNRLKDAVSKYGSQNWTAVSNYVGGGRLASNCYHRWTMSLRPDLKRGKWSMQEDKLLIDGVNAHGTKAWSKVCQFVPGRSQSQCRERFVNVLDTNLKRAPWSPEEDQLLLEACKPYKDKTIPWSKVAKQIPHRTDAMCTNRWRQLHTDEVVLQQFTRQALKKATVCLGRTSEKMDSSALDESVPEAIREKIEHFKQRYIGKHRKRSMSELWRQYFPSPHSVAQMDNARLNDLLTHSQLTMLHTVTCESFKDDRPLAPEVADILLASFLSANADATGNPSGSDGLLAFIQGSKVGTGVSEDIPDAIDSTDSTDEGPISSVCSTSASTSTSQLANGSSMATSQLANGLSSDTMATFQPANSLSSNVMATSADVDWLDVLMSRFEDSGEVGRDTSSSLDTPTQLKPLPSSFHSPPTTSTSPTTLTLATPSAPPTHDTAFTDSGASSVVCCEAPLTPTRSVTGTAAHTITPSSNISDTGHFSQLPFSFYTPPQGNQGVSPTPVTSSTLPPVSRLTSVTSSTTSRVTPLRKTVTHSASSSAHSVTSSTAAHSVTPSTTAAHTGTSSTAAHSVTPSTTIAAHSVTPSTAALPVRDQLIHIGAHYFTRDGTGKIVRLTKKEARSVNSAQMLRGEGDFPLAPRFIVSPIIVPPHLQRGVGVVTTSMGVANAAVCEGESLSTGGIDTVSMTTSEHAQHTDSSSVMRDNSSSPHPLQSLPSQRGACPLTKGSLGDDAPSTSSVSGGTSDDQDRTGLLSENVPTAQRDDGVTFDPSGTCSPGNDDTETSAILAAVRTSQMSGMLVGEETLAYIALPNDYTMSQRYSVDPKVVDGVSLIDVEGLDETTPPDGVQTDDPAPMYCEGDLFDMPSSADSALVSDSYSTQTTSGSHGLETPPTIVGRPPPAMSGVGVVTPDGSRSSMSLYTGRPFSEVELAAAAQLLKFMPSSNNNTHKTKAALNREKLEAFLSDMAGFDLPTLIAEKEEPFIEPYAHMIVYEPNTACFFFKCYMKGGKTQGEESQSGVVSVPISQRHVTRTNAKRGSPRMSAPDTTQRGNPLLTPPTLSISDDFIMTSLSTEELISQHFALSNVPVPPVKRNLDKMIGFAVVSEYHHWIQVYELYETCLSSCYCSYRKAPSKRTREKQVRRGGGRDRKQASGPGRKQAGGRDRKRKVSELSTDRESDHHIVLELSDGDDDERQQRKGRKRKTPSKPSNSKRIKSAVAGKKSVELVGGGMSEVVSSNHDSSQTARKTVCRKSTASTRKKRGGGVSRNRKVAMDTTPSKNTVNEKEVPTNEKQVLGEESSSQQAGAGVIKETDESIGGPNQDERGSPQEKEGGSKVVPTRDGREGDVPECDNVELNSGKSKKRKRCSSSLEGESVPCPKKTVRKSRRGSRMKRPPAKRSK